MRVILLASGSGGNACVVESGSTRVLMDAGLSSRELERRMNARGIAPTSIAAIFLSHEHNDHSTGALTFSSKWGCPIFATAGTADALELDGTLFAPYVRVEPRREGHVGAIGYRALDIPHDANESVTYAFEADDARLVVASDLGRAEPSFVEFLRESTALLLEFNHDEDLLRDGPYTWPLKQRIAGGLGHLSNRQSAEALAKAAGPRLRTVIATHLSKVNNEPALALAAVTSALERADCGARSGIAGQVDGFEDFVA
ncbi:MAG TPA: MBL fold metallo-hydrolase [Thermoanaerobaculia bacterium]